MSHRSGLWLVAFLFAAPFLVLALPPTTHALNNYVEGNWTSWTKIYNVSVTWAGGAIPEYASIDPSGTVYVSNSFGGTPPGVFYAVFLNGTAKELAKNGVDQFAYSGPTSSAYGTYQILSEKNLTSGAYDIGSVYKDGALVENLTTYPQPGSIWAISADGQYIAAVTSHSIHNDVTFFKGVGTPASPPATTLQFGCGNLETASVAYKGDGTSSRLITIPFKPNFFEIYTGNSSGIVSYYQADWTNNTLTEAISQIVFPSTGVTTLKLSDVVSATTIDVGKIAVVVHDGNTNGKNYRILLYGTGSGQCGGVGSGFTTYRVNYTGNGLASNKVNVPFLPVLAYINDLQGGGLTSGTYNAAILAFSPDQTAGSLLTISDTGQVVTRGESQFYSTGQLDIGAIDAALTTGVGGLNVNGHVYSAYFYGPSSGGGTYSATCAAQWFLGKINATNAYCTQDEDPYVTIQTSPTNLISGLVVNGTTYNKFGPILLGAGEVLNVCANPTADNQAFVEYTFNHWSDSGARCHTITVPNHDAVYTAYFTITGAGNNCNGTPLTEMFNGCYIGAAVDAMSGVLGRAPWFGFILLGVNVALYNKTQSIWISLTVLLISGAVFAFVVPVFVGRLAEIFLALGVAGIAVKAILAYR